jgi:hypothetical protein
VGKPDTKLFSGHVGGEGSPARKFNWNKNIVRHKELRTETKPCH